MKSYDSFSEPAPKKSSKWLFLSMLLIFSMTLATFSFLEIRNLNTDEPSVVRIIMNSFKSNEESDVIETSDKNKFILVNVEQQQDTEELLSSIITKEESKVQETERKTREAPSNNSYYEEQSPVVVYAKSGQEAPLAYRQPANVPPLKEDSYEEEPYNDDQAEGRQNPYYNSEEEGGYYQGDQEQQPYYRPEGVGDQEQQPYYRPEAAPGSQYEGYADSGEYSSEQQESEEGRASQQDSYYRQWHYATPAPSYTAGSNKKFSSMSDQEKRKLQTMSSSKSQQNRDPFPAYMDDYDYMPPHAQPSSQQVQAYHGVSSSSSQAVDKPVQQEMTFLSILKTLKAMWDLYQSFISSWNTMAQRHNKEEALAKKKYREQMQLRTQANKQQQKLNNKKTTERTTKNPKKQQTTSTTTTTTTMSPSMSSNTEGNYSSEDETQEEPIETKNEAKVEPRKGSKGDKRNSKQAEGLREKRQTSDNTEMAESVEEGRYIKGDPLKGYYDFVITEGSYKFWAAFQVGTALLIIYSTFAAIYYSKVNPLVSDYDYTDYLGGRSLNGGGDLDFVDDETAPTSSNAQQKSWSDWLPRSGHSLKFILDAIDKLPTDLLNEGTEDQESINKKTKEKIRPCK